MKCKSCGKNQFYIEKLEDCLECEYNGAWSDDQDKYIYNEGEVEKLKLERGQASTEGECFFSETSGEGCYLFICCNCGKKENLPLYMY